jgi:glycosyltransferase involved in cell wall biosynthesis
MAERKQINILYFHTEQWIAAVYYICNIIKALDCLPDNKKPQLNVLYGRSSLLEALKALNYPYIEYREQKNSLIKRIINRCWRMTTGKNPLKYKIRYRLPNLFLVETYYELSNVKQPIAWIPDFQEKYLPHFFSDKIIRERNFDREFLVESNMDIVFSSNNARNDFDKFYPHNTNKKHLLQFASVIDLHRLFQISETEMRNKYSLDKPYYIVSNQFWAHKNHITVLKALKIMKETRPGTLAVFTGKEHDYRNTDYTQGLKMFVSENNLEDNVRFLGLIDRTDQLALMKFSISVIQPSLFEGWSTVVEDCKTIGKHIFLSSLPVHLEQISENVTFFNPSDETELAELLLKAETAEYRIYMEKELTENLKNRMLKFANDFLSIFN